MEEKIEQIKETQEDSEFLLKLVAPFCDYIKKEVEAEGVTKGILVIAVDGDTADEKDHVMMFGAGNMEHIIQAIGNLYGTPQGEVLRQGVESFTRRFIERYLKH